MVDRPQTVHYERTHWALGRGWGDEGKATKSSSLLITTFGSFETQAGSERALVVLSRLRSPSRRQKKHEIVAY